ncbi:MAG TPA: hypothetical protein VHC22_32260 [Pirellulales bacterium]|nr:hypothetical protein [Pirellulales bacterium]
MPTLFHGTRLNFARHMAGTAAAGQIDVTLGGGEYGRGFYTQKSQANALAWAINRFSPAAHPCVLQLDVQDPLYLALNIKLLDLKDAKKLTQKLRKTGTTKTYLHGGDVVVGPLNLNTKKEQQKFESNNGQALLNGRDTTRRVI